MARIAEALVRTTNRPFDGKQTGNKCYRNQQSKIKAREVLRELVEGLTTVSDNTIESGDKYDQYGNRSACGWTIVGCWPTLTP